MFLAWSLNCVHSVFRFDRYTLSFCHAAPNITSQIPQITSQQNVAVTKPCALSQEKMWGFVGASRLNNNNIRVCAPGFTWTFCYCMVNVFLCAVCISWIVMSEGFVKVSTKRERERVMKATLCHFEALLWCVGEAKHEEPWEWRERGRVITVPHLAEASRSLNFPFVFWSVCCLSVRFSLNLLPPVFIATLCSKYWRR